MRDNRQVEELPLNSTVRLGPTMVPVVQKIVADKKLNVETFLGIGGALYAGALGSFASIKNRKFGMMAQVRVDPGAEL